MILVISKRKVRAVSAFLAAAAVLVTVQLSGKQMLPVIGETEFPIEKPVIVIDAGHGGEDGGAVASDGTVESQINLAIAQRLNLLLRFLGHETLMTRDSDISIYSEGAGTLHEKKVSDLKNRVQMINSAGKAVLVSIHQNCMPSAPRVHGAQTFFNTEDGAQMLALSIQNVLNSTINQENSKEIKKISSTIYLMKNITAPAALVECGFLSNQQETAQLKNPEYQTRMASVITAGILQCIG